MKKLYTRFFTSLFMLLLCFIAANAQTLDLTFKRTGTTANSTESSIVTVTPNGIEGVDATGITATIASNYAWLPATESTHFDKDAILCPNKNANSNGYNAVFTITLNNVPEALSFSNVLFTSVAMSANGGYQGSTGNRPVNFTLAKGDTELSSLENQSIKVYSGNGLTLDVTMAVTNTYTADSDNSLTLTLTLSNPNGGGAGCFYGLMKVSMNVGVENGPISSGKVYRFVNKSNANIVMTASSGTDVHGRERDDDNYAQQWYVEKHSSNNQAWTLRSLGNGRYLQHSGQSRYWTFVDNASTATPLFLVSPAEGYYTFNSSNNTGGYTCMHYATSQGGAVVGWSADADATRWTIEEVEISNTDLEARLDEVDEFNNALSPEYEANCQTALDNLFSDKACTVLKKSFASVAAIEADADYKALPTALKNMVKKVYNKNWSEANGATDKPQWDNEYAKKFRVQMYEPYSIEGEVTSYLRINANRNMDNPTGIYANNLTSMYIMVDGDIEEGAELWLCHKTGHGLLGAYSEYNGLGYVQLQKGLNIVPYYADGTQLWINYLVHTYNASGTTITEKFPRKISDYKPLKIHIEGGHINSYYNAIGDFRASDSQTENLWGDVDNDEDWNYYKERVPLNGTDGPNSDYPLLGHRQVLVFEYGSIVDNDGNEQNGIAYHLDRISVPSTPNNNSGSYTDYTGMGLNATNGKINIMLEAWDRIAYSQLATMGLLSDATMEKMNEMYPRWTASGSTAEIYNYGNADIAGESTNYRAFCNGLDYSEYYNHHGIALGAYSGYMSGGWPCCNYHYNTMSSIIGNLAAEAGPTWGPAHEIGHQNQNPFTLNGQTEVTNNLFSNVAVWYMGMATSRYNGSEGSLQSVLEAYNTEGNDAYTNNIWALTHMYYRLWLYYHLAGNNTQFWPRLYELLRMEPLLNGGNIDGETSLLRFYQHSCDAAGEDLTEFFRAHGYLEVMENRLVGDYSNATYNQTQEQIDAAISAIKAKGYPENLAILFINDGTAETTVAHDGETSRKLWDANATAEFGSVSDFVSGEVSIETAYTATVSEDGTVTMSGGEGGVGFLILDDNGKILSFSNNSSFTISEDAAYKLATGDATVATVDDESETTTAELDLSAMQASLFSELVNKVDDIIALADDTNTKVGFYKSSALVELTEAYLAAREVMEKGTGYAAAYELLYSEYQKLMNNDHATVPFSPNSTYILTNYAYPERTMIFNGTTANAALNADKTSDDARWQFVATSTADVYNVKSVSGYYCPAITKSSAMTLTTDQNGAGNYILQHMGNGVWVVRVTPTNDFTCFHSSSNDNYNVVGWSTTEGSRWYLTAVEADEDFVAIDELETLIAQTNELIDEVATIDMEETNIALQATNASNPYYITCNEIETSEGSIEYLVDGITNVGSNFFHSRYNDKKENLHYLTVDLGTGNTIGQFKFNTVNRTFAGGGGFPKRYEIKGSTDGNTFTDIATVTTKADGSGESFASEVLGNGAAKYRYLRFDVVDCYNSYNVYFHLAEFDLYSVTPSVTMNEDYATVAVTHVLTAYEEIQAANALLNSGNPTKAQVEAAEATLLSAYNELKNDADDAKSAALEAEKAALQALIDDTNELIATVANETTIVEVDLNGKLYSNAPYLADGTGHSDYSSVINNYNLIDNDNTTYFHSDYSGNKPSDPYLRVDVGKGISKFQFNYTTRNQSTSLGAPELIDIYGGNYDENALELIDADHLMSYTSPVRIVIKNISGSNSYYFAGTSNVEDYSTNLIFVWEPVTEGTAGVYYLKKESEGENGYIQTGNSSLTFGSRASAQKFFAFRPIYGKDVATYEKVTNETFEGDRNRLVRFVQQEYNSTTYPGGVWINCSDKNGKPFYVTSGKYGGYTVHNVYIVGAPVYDSEPIATLNTTDSGLPTTQNASWTSDEINAEKSYRYYKFKVTNSSGYFVMSEFGFTQIGDLVIKDKYKDVVSVELLNNTVSAINDAETMLDIATTVAQLQNQQARLQKAHDALAAAMENASDLPILLTTDVNNPIVYKIGIKRGDTKVLQYDLASTGMVAVADYSEGNTLQGWYFTKGSADDKVYIHPYVGGGDVLGADNTSNGAAKVSAVVKGSKEHEEWLLLLVNHEDGIFYNIKAGDDSNYFSNFGGTNNKMGFYGDSNTTDTGSLFTFTRTSFENGVWENTLDAYVDNLCVNESLTESVNPGYYSNVSAYNSARPVAVAALANAGSTENEFKSAYTELRKGYEALSINVLEPGKFYTLRSNYVDDHYVFANASNVVRYGNAYNSDGADSRYIWQFVDNGDGTYMLKNVHTNCYSPSLQAVDADFSLTDVATSAGSVIIEKMGAEEGLVQIKSGNAYYHANKGTGAECKLIGWSTGAANAMYIEEAQASDISYKVNIDEYKWNTLYLSYPVTIPDGISAYTAYEADGDYIKLTEVSDVIPANTAVFVYSETAAYYEFVYSADAAVAVAEDKNLLEGCLWTSAVECLDGYNYYMMLVGSTGAKMYWIYEEYSEDGTIHDGNAQSDNGGYILCNANRAYMPLLSSTAAGTISYRFDFSGATGIDDGVTENRGEDVIFDLNGRRIKEVTAPGIYIVNGKKCYIKNIKNILK